MQRIVAMVSALAALMVSACASLSGGSTPPAAESRVLTGASGISAFVGPCTIVTSERGESAVLSALAMGAIERGFDLFAGALIAAGDREGGKAQATAQVPVELSARTTPTCLYLTRGRFAPNLDTAWNGAGEPRLPGAAHAGAAPGDSASANGGLSTEGDEENSQTDSGQRAQRPQTPAEAPWPQLAANTGMGLAERPAFFAEIAIERARNGRAIRFVPNFIAFERPMRSFAFRTSTERSIALDLTLYAPGSEANAALSTHLDLGRYAPGARAQFPRPNAAPGVGESYTRPFASPWLQLPQLPADMEPHNLRIAVTEIQDPNVAAAFAGEVLRGARAQFMAAAGQAVDPTQRAAAELAATNARYTLQRTYNTALVDACAALVTLQNAQGDANMLGLTRDAAEKQMTANAAAQAADLPMPFITVVQPSLTKPNVSRAMGACGAPAT